jgi:lipoprotein NlpI
MKKQDFDGVIHEATKAINFDKTLKKAYLNRAFAFDKLEKDEDALEDLKEV